MTDRTAARRRQALGLIATAQFMAIMDTSIIGVTLPKMRADLGFSQDSLSWAFKRLTRKYRNTRRLDPG